MEKGIIMLLVCAALSNSNRVAGTSGLWSSGRPTPDGGARDGKKNGSCSTELEIKIFILNYLFTACLAGIVIENIYDTKLSMRGLLLKKIELKNWIS